MNPYRMAPPPRRWVPKLSPWLVQMTRGHRRKRALRECQLTDIDVQNAEVVRQAVDAGQGVLITPNHPTHADAYTAAAAADVCGCPFYYMATWHVFDSKGKFGQWVLQKFGVFSIDREGTDLEAVKIARGILQKKSQPLIIFPEGEVYHCNDRITPFREGAAAIAMFSARKATRPIVVIPTALKYRYVEDPTADLLELMDTLEESIHWRPRPDLDLPERIYALGGALMALKELEFLSEVRSGSLPERTDFLARHILTSHEQQHGIDSHNKTIPERVKELRRIALEKIAELDEDSGSEAQNNIHNMLDEVFLVVQLFSYPGDYVIEKPTVERLAETLDKFEEDVMRCYSATVRGRRQATIRFGDPIPVEYSRDRTAISTLTSRLEEQVQQLLVAMG
ncbi:MAG: 1-acyl-sn-glycerol-3-phosphate acyltransferase [Pirellulales bacterium]|nr:1-acyl-sn-glycerol-3-phosphate acyltransferase [Pirellulales bacterium]